MAARPVLPLVGPLLVLAACNGDTITTVATPYPDMKLSQDQLEFGKLEWGETQSRTVVLSNEGFVIENDVLRGMDMGVGSHEDSRGGIDIGPGMAGSFTVAWNEDDIECDPLYAGSESAGDGEGTSPDAKADSGGGGGGGNDSEGGGSGGDSDGGPTDSGDGGGEGYLFLLPPSCSIPITVKFSPADVGDVWGSLLIDSVQAATPVDDNGEPTDELPEYLRDPVNWSQQVWLHGEAENGQGAVVVSPRNWDFGYVYPGGEEAEPARVAISNVGTGEITVGSATLTADCDGAFAITSETISNRVLAAGESTLVEVAYTPDNTDAAYCEMEVTSNDAANSLVSVTLKGNSGADPDNTPPTAAVRWPEPGYEYNSPSPLDLEINVFDKNQPADSLTCRVKSMLQGANIADCTPSDASGHVVLSIPRDSFNTGVDTLTVVVTDAEGISAEASVSVLVNTAYPDSDDDGDGFGVESDPPDCDDHNRDSYPEAAEVFDGEDNDCDGVTDEGTEGYDDDGDAVTEAEGDCNDYNAQVYPGAPERADSVDNDCDGRTDETTSLYDDDGDGFAEVNLDCNDADPDVSPAATEICDGIDNDCDGLEDSADGCISTDSEPIVVGTPRPSQNACMEGESIALSAEVFDADGQATTYLWGDDKSTNGFDNATAQTVNWTCPQLEDGISGRNYTLFVLATDLDGQQVWGYTVVTVYPDDHGLYDDYEVTTVTEGSGCGWSAGGGAASAVGVLGLAALLRRRRSD
ncbi:MAG: choice-of-anchor D domain-containing protein [Deltaproteobacteria bacterium]|nr:choice-of-anchor D domain-containing protein [Deltaproteobacteria bacterium]